ncbi:MAG: hypothetical protein AMJ54_13655 [Deltaproteobacteria bacterium SG8_13]|nr:MAG: hypothetical protein AMJ54_13655 [Deltaproteobacteria bacterium SG8_13]
MQIRDRRMNRSTTKKRSTPKSRTLLASVRKAYERFLKIRGHPREISLGFALGLLVGMTPFMGLHTIVAVAVAALFKWNKISAAISVWITNAVTAPIIYSITYLVGARMMGLKKAFALKEINSLSAIHDLILKTPEIVWAMMVGGMVIGLPLAVIGYYIAFSITSRYQEEIKAKIARSKEKLVHKRQQRKAKAAGVDVDSREFHAAISGDRNPTDAKADPSTITSDQ